MSLYHDTCHHRIYNLTCAQFDELHEYAQGECQICSTPESETTRGRLVIDHLGEYGSHAVRGLLCDKCNSLMSRVDRGVARATREVMLYRYNSYFARLLSPHGPNIRYDLPRLETGLSA